MHLEHRRSSETLFQKGDDSTALYLIKSGWVRLLAPDGSALASQGPGSLVGETDLFLDQPRSLGAVTVSETELWVLSREDLTYLLADNPQVGLKLTLAFGSRLALFDQYLVEYRLKPQSFLSGLSDEVLLTIARRLVPLEKKEGEFVVEGGQSPEALFIVEAGQLNLHSTEEGGDFSTLGAGETFGEMAVLTGKHHTRSAQAATDAIVWALPAAEFEALATQYPDIRLALSQAIREPLRSEDQERAVARLATMTLFQGLSEEVLWAVSERLLLHHVPAGELIFADGAPGDALYLIDSGQVELVSGGRGGGAVLARLGTDEFFGEMALLTGKPRSTAARAATHTNLWVLYRADFDDLVNRHPAISLALSRVLSERLAEMDRRFTESHLRGLKLLTGLSSSQLEDISRRLQPARYRRREVILREGDPGDAMYFIESGQAQVVRGHGPNARLLAELDAGDLFGEMALLTDSPRSATVTALSDLDVWVLPQADFDDLVTAYPNLALALSRLLSERLRHTDERYLTQPVIAPVAEKARPRPRPAAAPTPRPRPQPQPAAETVRMPRPAAAPARPPQPRPRPRPAARPAPVRARPAPVKAPPAPRKPRRKLSAELGEAFGGLAAWFGALSAGAKVRLIVVTMLLVWLLCIAAPALVISTLAADHVNNLAGAIAFVQTEPPLPTEALPPTDAPEVAPVVLSAPPAESFEAEPVARAVEMPTREAAPPAPAPSDTAEPVAAQPAGPTPTPTPWIIVITNTPPPPTDTPIPPTDTPVPPKPTRAPTRAPSSAAAAPVPQENPQPPRDLDPRLDALGVVIEPAGARTGQQYWRLVKVRWQNQQESGNDHTIYIEVLDENGNRIINQPIEIRWQSGSLLAKTEDKPPNEYPANFPMYNTLGSYSVKVAGGLPSDVIVGLGMGTPDAPDFTIHTNFFLTFRRVTR